MINPQIRKCLESGFFITLCLFLILFFLNVTYFALNSKPLLLGRIDNDHFTSYVIVLAGVCTAMGKFLGGWLFDQFDFYHLMTVSIIGNIVGGFLFYFYAYNEFFIVLSIILMNTFGNFILVWIILEIND